MAGKIAGATVDVDVAELEVVDEAEGDGSGVCGVFGYAKRPGAAGRSPVEPGGNAARDYFAAALMVLE